MEKLEEPPLVTLLSIQHYSSNLSCVNHRGKHNIMVLYLCPMGEFVFLPVPSCPPWETHRGKSTGPLNHTPPPKGSNTPTGQTCCVSRIGPEALRNHNLVHQTHFLLSFTIIQFLKVWVSMQNIAAPYVWAFLYFPSCFLVKKIFDLFWQNSVFFLKDNCSAFMMNKKTNNEYDSLGPLSSTAKVTCYVQ